MCNTFENLINEPGYYCVTLLKGLKYFLSYNSTLLRVNIMSLATTSVTLLRLKVLRLTNTVLDF